MLNVCCVRSAADSCRRSPTESHSRKMTAGKTLFSVRTDIEGTRG